MITSSTESRWTHLMFGTTRPKFVAMATPILCEAEHRSEGNQSASSHNETQIHRCDERQKNPCRSDTRCFIFRLNHKHSCWRFQEGTARENLWSTAHDRVAKMEKSDNNARVGYVISRAVFSGERRIWQHL